jgi:NADH:ubiquinone oxidoreductase subunit 6 (subunit J)
VLLALCIVGIAIVASAASIVASRDAGRTLAYRSFILASSALALLLGWGFVAALQILVCGLGVPLVLATVLGTPPERRAMPGTVEWFVRGAAVVAALAIVVAAVAGWRQEPKLVSGNATVYSAAVAAELLTTFVVPFGIVGLVLLAALVGVVSETRRSQGASNGE